MLKGNRVAPTPSHLGQVGWALPCTSALPVPPVLTHPEQRCCYSHPTSSRPESRCLGLLAHSWWVGSGWLGKQSGCQSSNPEAAVMSRVHPQKEALSGAAGTGTQGPAGVGVQAEGLVQF